MDIYCKILPDFIDYNSCINTEDLIEKAYAIFCEELFNLKIKLNSKPIHFFPRPITDGYEQGFYHMTTVKSEISGSRSIDIYRTQRIAWIKPLIENHICTYDCCNGPFVWTDSRTNRLHIYHHIKKYLVVLKEKSYVYDFITAFYVESVSQHKKLMKKVNKNTQNC